MDLTALGLRRHHSVQQGSRDYDSRLPEMRCAPFHPAFQGYRSRFLRPLPGLWLDAGELEALLNRTGASAEDPLLHFQQQQGMLPNGRPHLCPRCDEPLREITVAPPSGDPLTLDRCPRGHGLWFDADELTQLLAMFPPEVGARKTIDHLNELFSMTSKH